MRGAGRRPSQLEAPLSHALTRLMKILYLVGLIYASLKDLLGSKNGNGWRSR